MKCFSVKSLGFALIAVAVLAIFGSFPLQSLAKTLDGKVIHNPCVDATKADVAASQMEKAEAVSLRDAGDYASAAAKFFEAADSNPQAPVAALWRLNGVGCLLGTYDNGYIWDPTRGPENAQAAYKQLDQVSSEISEAEKLDCDCAAGKGSGLAVAKRWWANQLAFLKTQVDRKP